MYRLVFYSVIPDATTVSDQSKVVASASHGATETTVTYNEPADTTREVMSTSPMKAASTTATATTSTPFTLSAQHPERDVEVSLGSRLLTNTQLPTGRPPVVQATGVPPPDWPMLTGAGGQLTFGRHQPGYDIYPGLHNHAGGQFFRMAKRTQLLFPQVDRKVCTCLLSFILYILRTLLSMFFLFPGLHILIQCRTKHLLVTKTFGNFILMPLLKISFVIRWVLTIALFGCCSDNRVNSLDTNFSVTQLLVKQNFHRTYKKRSQKSTLCPLSFYVNR